MTTATVNHSISANLLNKLVTELNVINDQYCRQNGTMVMISEDTENRILGLCTQIQEVRDRMASLTDDEIFEIFSDVDGYRRFLLNVQEMVDANFAEACRAKEFLSGYYSH